MGISVAILTTVQQSLRTFSFSLMLLLAMRVGKLLTCRDRALPPNKAIWERAITTENSSRMKMAAKYTVAMEPWLVKTALVVASVITRAVHANASVDTQALLVSRWNRCHKLSWHLAILLMLNKKKNIGEKKKKKKKKKS